MIELISVIVPVYNVEKYLARCIDSILVQTYKNIEILLIDDGALDNSGNICDEYEKKDMRVKVIHKKNGGLSDARNCGIENATGDFLSFIDSDDWIEPEFLETLYNSLKENNADISVVGINKFYDDGRVVEEICPPVGCVDDTTQRCMLLERYMVYSVVAWNKLYKKEMFDEIRYPKGYIHEDEYVAHKLMYKAERVCFSDRPLYNYYQRTNSIMGAFREEMSEKNFYYYLARKDRAEFYKAHGLKSLYKVAQRVCLIAMVSAVKKMAECDYELSEKWLVEFEKSSARKIRYIFAPSIMQMADRMVFVVSPRGLFRISKAILRRKNDGR